MTGHGSNRRCPNCSSAAPHDRPIDPGRKASQDRIHFACLGGSLPCAERAIVLRAPPPPAKPQSRSQRFFIEQLYSCETGKVILSHSVPSPASSVAVAVAAPRRRRAGVAGVSGDNDNLGGRSSGATVILHAFTKAGQIHRWHLPPRISISAALSSASGVGVGSEGGGGGSAQQPGAGTPSETGGRSGAAVGSASEGSRAGGGGGRQGRVRAAMALPASSSFFSGGGGDGGADGGSNGRQLIVFAGDKGLVAMDAGRGVVVQELTGAGADEVQGGSGDGGSGSGGGSGGVSHVAVTPDGGTVISVGDGDVSFGLFGVFAPRRLAVSCLCARWLSAVRFLVVRVISVCVPVLSLLPAYCAVVWARGVSRHGSRPGRPRAHFPCLAT